MQAAFSFFMENAAITIMQRDNDCVNKTFRFPFF
jgi:hypothetical protein